MPAAFVFIVGLLLDLIAQGPVGIQVLRSPPGPPAPRLKLRRSLTRSGFAVVWLTFIAVAACAALLEWLLVCLLTWTVLPSWPAFFEFAVSAGIYPLLAALLIRAHRGLAAPRTRPVTLG